MHPVRDRRDRHVLGVEARPEVAEHAAAHLAVQLRDAVRALREPQAHHGHVERARRRVRAGLDAQGERIGRVDAREQRTGEVALDEGAVEPVDACGNRRVGGEHRARAHQLERLGEREALGDVRRDALEAEESGVALVHVEHVGRGSAAELGEGAHRSSAADAEQELLEQAVLPPAAVEAIGDGSELVVVRGDVGVEQEQRDAADRGLPHAGVQRLVVGQRQRDLHGRAVGAAQHRERQPVGVEHRVALLLPAVGRDRLGEVARLVEQADADQRDAEVGGRLEVVAREDAEPARVLRQRGGDAELGREVRHRARRVGAERLEPARLREVRAEPGTLALGPLHVPAVRGELVEPRGVDLAEERHGVPPGAAPQLGVDVLEQALRRLVPRPPEVARELLERGQRAGDDGADGELANGLHAVHPKSTSCRMCERDGLVRLRRALERRRRPREHTRADASSGRLAAAASGSRRAGDSALRSERDHPRSARRPNPSDAGHARPARRQMEAEGLRGRGRAVPRDRLPRGPRPGGRDAGPHEPVGPGAPRADVAAGARHRPVGGRRRCSTSRASGTGTSRDSTTRSPRGGTTPR